MLEDVIKQNVGAAVEKQQMASRQDYAAIDQQAGGVKVDIKPLKQTAQKILSDSNFVRQIARARSKES